VERRSSQELHRVVVECIEELEGRALAGELVAVHKVISKHQMHRWVFYRHLKEHPELQKRFNDLSLHLDTELMDRAFELTLQSADNLKADGFDFRQANQVLQHLKLRAGAAAYHGRDTPLIEAGLEIRRLEGNVTHDLGARAVEALGVFASISNRLQPPALPAKLDAEVLEAEVVGVLDLDSGEIRQEAFDG
jgi:hypothetical protein